MTTHEKALEAGAAREAACDGRDFSALSKADKHRYIDRFADGISAYLSALTPPDVEERTEFAERAEGSCRTSDLTAHEWQQAYFDETGRLERTLTHLAAENALLREREGWKPIETAPKDGTKFMVWADGYEWPEVIFYELYDDESAAEVGELGYWRYAEDLIAEVTDALDVSELTHWRYLPASPSHQEQRT